VRAHPLPSAQQNIETVARLEQQFLEQRSTVDRIGDAVGSFVGTMWFVIVHLAWFSFWFLANSDALPGLRPFDPYPFIFLSMAVSVEGVLLTTFVLMKQNRMAKRADLRNQLNLQVDLLSEKEVTKILQMLCAMADHMGLQQEAAEPEILELSQKTAVEALAKELRNKMPD
jgi:uncharacterized membrane protein